MNQIVETMLLTLLIPISALAFIVVGERLKMVSNDELRPTERHVTPPKPKIVLLEKQ